MKVRNGHTCTRAHACMHAKINYEPTREHTKQTVDDKSFFECVHCSDRKAVTQETQHGLSKTNDPCLMGLI